MSQICIKVGDNVTITISTQEHSKIEPIVSPLNGEDFYQSMFEIEEDEPMSKANTYVTCTCGRKMDQKFYDHHITLPIHNNWLQKKKDREEKELKEQNEDKPKKD